MTANPSAQYISVPVTTDPNTLTQQALANFAAAVPGWVARESAPEVILIEQFAAMCAESARVAAQVPMTIFAYFGTMVGVMPLPGAAATVDTTWTFTGAEGYIVPSGTQVAFRVNGSQSAIFITTSAVQVSPGQTSVDITLQAVGAGSAYNGIATGTMQLISPLNYVADVVSTTVTAGGADPETLPAYLNRLSNELQYLAPRPILAADYAGISTNVPGVYRAFAVDGLSPGRSFGAASLTSASDILTSLDANFTAADVGRTITDSAGAIPANTTIASIPNTTVASGSAGAVLPVATLYLTSTTGWPSSGTVTFQLDANDFTTVTYTGISGNELTGCSGGSGTLAQGVLAYCGSQCTMSANATATAADDTITLADLTNQERTVALAAVDENGDTLDSTTSTTLRDYLLARREANFVVNILTPTYSPINVTYEVVSAPGANTQSILSAVSASLSSVLSQAAWGGGNQNPPTWDTSANWVRYSAILGLIAAIPGVQYVKSLAIGIAGQSLQQTDIELPGDAPLTQVGTIIGNVTPGT